LAKFDNSLAGLFQNKMGGVNVSRMSGFNLQKISDDFGKMSYAGSAQKSNATTLAASPYVTITDLSD